MVGGKSEATKPDFTNERSKRGATRSATIEVHSLRSCQQNAVLSKGSQPLMVYMVASFAWTPLLPFLSGIFGGRGEVVHHNRNPI